MKAEFRSWKESDSRLASKNFLTSCQMTQGGRFVLSMGEEVLTTVDVVVWCGENFLKVRTGLHFESPEHILSRRLSFEISLTCSADFSHSLLQKKVLVARPGSPVKSRFDLILPLFASSSHKKKWLHESNEPCSTIQGKVR